MKNMLRASGLVTVLALTALSTANAQTSGTCRTRCVGSNPFSFTIVAWSTSQSICCSGLHNPCPSGTTPVTPSTWAPYGGAQEFCGPEA